MAKFQKGQSGNPAGRPPGHPTKATKLRALLEPHAEGLIARAVAMAKNGDSVALRLCLERLLPAYKAEGRMVVDAVAAGTLSVDEGNALIQAIAGLARVIEVDELERRIAVLEAKGGNDR